MKPTKVSSFRNRTTYRLGQWLVTITRSTQRGRSQCGLRSTTSHSDWYAVNTGEPGTPDRTGYGGITSATKALA